MLLCMHEMLHGYRAISYPRVRRPSVRRAARGCVIEYDEDVLAALDPGDDFE